LLNLYKFFTLNQIITGMLKNASMKNHLILLILLLINNTLPGIADNPRVVNPNGISLYAMGPNAVGSISYDYFITPSINSEVGIGYIGVHAGIKLHFWGRNDERQWTPYIGASVARSLFRSVGVDYLPYFPAGISFAGKNHFNFSFEIAPIQLKFSSWNVAGVKFGYRF
jgi:hypothetical protein